MPILVNCLETETGSDAIRTWRIGRMAAGALGLVFVVLYLFEGSSLPFGQMRAPGAGVFPIFVGTMFGFVCIGVMLEAAFTREPGTTSYPVGPDLQRLLLVSLCFVLYVALMVVIGFPIATVAFVACFARLVGKVSWLRATLSGMVLSASVWSIFTLVLGVRLPAGFWS